MSTLEFPPGYVGGCKPRRYAPGQICRMAADSVAIIPTAEWAGLIQERKDAGLSVRPFVKVIFDQGQVGSCATEAASQLVQTRKVMQGQPFVQLNPYFMYHTTSGGRDSGSSIDEDMEFARQYGIAPESVWPRSKGWQAKPSEEAYAAALENRLDEFFDCVTVQEIGSCLLAGHLVQFGWKSHSELMIELVSPTHALVINSWNKSWGDNGAHEVPLSSVNFSYGAYAGRTAN